MFDLQLSKILVCLDGSKKSLRSLDAAILLAKQCSASITGIHIVPIFHNFRNPHVSAIYDSLVKDAKNFLYKAKVACDENGVLFHEKILRGDVSMRIVSYAKKNKIDLIVMGSRGRGLAKEIFLGSVSNSVVHNTDLPVLIVK